jgi:hypothetical protein
MLHFASRNSAHLCRNEMNITLDITQYGPFDFLPRKIARAFERRSRSEISQIIKIFKIEISRFDFAPRKF